MEFFRIQKDIPFMKHAIVLNAISAITFVLAVAFLVLRGLNLSVEFTGGTVMEVAYEQPADLAAVRHVVESLGYADVPVQNFGTSRDVLLRLPVLGRVAQGPTLLRLLPGGGWVAPLQQHHQSAVSYENTDKT